MDMLGDQYLQSLIRVIFYLGAIIILIFIIRAFLLRKLKFDQRLHLKEGAELKVLNRQYLGMKKYLLIVEFQGQKILLGVSETNISYLTSLTDHQKGFDFQLKQNLKNNPEGRVHQDE